ncbi:MAG: hypothetical protein M1831_006006 [Alyxoria varia]|nr:MAG: hypothetical protein M1831_006006 [Alyxoria varia]
MKSVEVGGVDGGGFISDESSFYGGEDAEEEWEERAKNSDLHAAIEYQSRLPAALAYVESSKPLPVLRNPREGESTAWQLNESIADFIERLRPSTSTCIDTGPWIWASNPHVEHHPVQSDLAGLTERGTELLQKFQAFQNETEMKMQGKARTTIGRKLSPKRTALEKDLRQAALDFNVRVGKWMLFPTVENVDHDWKLVAKGTTQNKLGIDAKVATAGEDRDPGQRLICIYTRDFDDTNDVRRVLKELVSMGLVREDSQRGIFYKCDAYTHLGIERGNDWGLGASLYGSRSML